MFEGEQMYRWNDEVPALRAAIGDGDAGDARILAAAGGWTQRRFLSLVPQLREADRLARRRLAQDEQRRLLTNDSADILSLIPKFGAWINTIRRSASAGKVLADLKSMKDVLDRSDDILNGRPGKELNRFVVESAHAIGEAVEDWPIHRDARVLLATTDEMINDISACEAINDELVQLILGLQAIAND